MLKTMIFIDYQNLNIESRRFYKSKKGEELHFDYLKFVDNIQLKLSKNFDCQVIKTYLFTPKPCDQLMNIPRYENYYTWLTNMKNFDYFEVIEGRQEIRQTNKDVNIDIGNSDTFTTVEKGTDVNLAVTMLTKAYSNAFDIAVLVSGDTDYIPVVEVLHQLGKIVVISYVSNQNVAKYDLLKDAYIKIDKRMLDSCNYRTKPTRKDKNQYKDKSINSSKNIVVEKEDSTTKVTTDEAEP